ncbi:MAG TPA: CPBP family intramembrane glutamic endopeptidase [Sporolactobacillaceae bacterium]|nr:CPBP family intramembrane glutamic endopeptidase [Sporolactobacillaceae bacterium]
MPTATNSSESDAQMRGVPNLAARRREAALLMALAIVGAVLEYPLALAIKSIDRSEIGRALPFLAITIALSSMVPFALRISPELGLPGAPLIAAKIAGEKLHFSIRSMIKIAAGYAFLAALVGAVVLITVIVPMMIAHPIAGGSKLPVPPVMRLAPGRIALVGALVAIAAAISEEIQFRLVLFAFFAWIVRLITRDSSGRSGRGALWFATILQAYAFGLVHLLPLASSMFHSGARLLFGAVLMPQTWEGIVFGRLYLKRGLEAAMLAHAIMDVALFALAAIGVLRAHLGSG